MSILEGQRKRKSAMILKALNKRMRVEAEAGKIIPAIATATSLVTGLVLCNNYHIDFNTTASHLRDYQNGFVRGESAEVWKWLWHHWPYISSLSGGKGGEGKSFG